MKIRSKLFLYFIAVAGFSTILATFVAVYSISKNYEDIAIEETHFARKSAESFFYDYSGELTRKAILLSEITEIADNMQDPDELFMAIENKSFFLYNINVKIISPQLEIITSFQNSLESHINQENLKDHPFFSEHRDPLLRDTGIFRIKEHICILAVSPIVDRQTFEFKGYILFEVYLNSEFADFLKDKTKSDILIVSQDHNLASTLQDSEGKRIFPTIPPDIDEKVRQLKTKTDKYLIDHFHISDYHKYPIGEIYVALNTKKIISAKQHGIKNMLTVLIVVVIIVIAVSLFIGRRLTNPILVLSRGAESISRGRFNIRTDPPSNDEIGHLTKVFRDMAESLKSQREEILDLKLFFEKIIDYSPSAIIICDDIGGVITINTAAEKMFGLNIKDIKGREVFDIINTPPSLKADFYKVIYSGNPTFHDSYPLFLPNEEERVFRLTIYRIIQNKRKSAAIQIEDITEGLRLEEELTHAMKLATLGDVLSRFTHEFNNLITGILGNIQLMKLGTNKDDAGFSRILSIEDLAAKAARLGQNILHFSKKERLKTECIDTAQMIDTVLELIEKTVLKNISIEKEYSDGPFYITVNNERFSLALLNLFINANDAVKKAGVSEGRIVIKIDREQKKDKKKKFIRIQISDNGIGIDKKTMDKIFLPYFTTKGEKGTGLGLTTVNQVIDESKGSISVKSKVNEGTTFTLKFPEAVEAE